MKRILTLVLALMLVFSLAATAETDKSGWLCEEKTTLTVCTYDGVSQAFPTIGNDLRFWQWLEEYTNVHIEWEVHSNADYGTVKAAKLAAGELEADIYNLGNTMCNEAGMAGLLIDMTPYMETCMPHTIKYAAEENPNVLKSAVNPIDGKRYMMVGSVSPDQAHICYIYNALWFEKMGFTWPETLDEFTEILRAMKGVDLNENGVDDEILLTAASIGNMDIMGNPFGLEAYESTSGFAAKDGVVYSEHIADATKEYWQYLNMLFEEGILDPGIATNSADKMSQAIAADKVAVFVYYAGFSNSYGNLTTYAQETGKTPYALGAPLKGPDGHRYYVRRLRDGGDGTGVSTACKNPELAIKWLDTMISDPVVLSTRCTGWEGEHHYYDENGEKQIIMPEDGSSWSVKAEGCGQIAMPHYQTWEQLNFSKKSPLMQWYVDQYAVFQDMFIDPSVVPTSLYTQDEQDLIDMVKSDVETYYKEMRAKFITGEVSFDKWDEYVDNMYALGLQDWLDAMQMYYDRVNA